MIVLLIYRGYEKIEKKSTKKYGERKSKDTESEE